MTEHWADLVDQEIHHSDGPKPKPESELRTAELLDGSLAVQGKLSMSDGEIVSAALDAAMRTLCPDLFENDDDPETGHETKRQRNKKNDDDVPVDKRTLAQKAAPRSSPCASSSSNTSTSPSRSSGNDPTSTSSSPSQS